MKQTFTGYGRLRRFSRRLLCLSAFAVGYLQASAQQWTPVAKGWAKNSVNTVIFRKNALVSFRGQQYIAFYDSDQYVVVGKRKLNTEKWTLHRTRFKGNAQDAHCSISIMADGAGYLHLAWNHHDNPLHYAKSKAPGSLTFGPEIPMTGKLEERVTYPEFYRLADGGLLFFYRDGASGQGNLVLDRYQLKTGKWVQVQSQLIDGQGRRNAYWQACVDQKGSIHLSWVWRESPDVATNHDLAYARSDDGGITWKKSGGQTYQLPITAANAEYACRIPQNSELINQTSMTSDSHGRPYIATYWKGPHDIAPQYHLVFYQSGKWQVQDLGFRKEDFSLSGGGTKRVPVSRPQVFVWASRTGNGKASASVKLRAGLLFRSETRGNKVSVAYTPDLATGQWKVKDLYSQDLSSWEPSFDTELWKTDQRMDVFVQNTPQADHEGKTETPAQMIGIVSFDPGQLLR